MSQQIQCWFNAGPASQTVCHHKINNGLTFCVCQGEKIRGLEITCPCYKQKQNSFIFLNNHLKNTDKENQTLPSKHDALTQSYLNVWIVLQTMAKC